MSKPKFVIGIIILVFLAVVVCGGIMLTGPAAGNHFGKFLKSNISSDYLVYEHSGGKIVRWYILRDNFVNTETNSDGYFFTYKNRLVRMSGPVHTEEVKGMTDDQIIQEFHLTPETRR